MLVTIEQKLSAIKAINEALAQVDLAIARHSMSKEINWTLISEETKEKIFALVQESYLEEKQKLVDKATELMK